MNFGIAGEFELHKQKVLMKDGEPVLDENGEQILIGERELVTKFKNLITDVGLENMGTGTAINSYVYLSSNTSTPLVTNTRPQGVIASSNSKVGDGWGDSSTVTPPLFTSGYLITRFNAGLGTGNISKIYTGNASATQDIWSEALIKDIAGDNTTITKLADEVLDVTYRLYWYVDNEDINTTIDISGVEYNVVIRLSRYRSSWCSKSASAYIAPSRIYLSQGDIRDKNSEGTSLSEISTSIKTYVPLSKRRSFVGTAGLSQANFPVRSAVVSGSGFAYQIRFGSVADDSPIPKTGDYKLILPELFISWGRYEPTTP